MAACMSFGSAAGRLHGRVAESAGIAAEDKASLFVASAATMVGMFGFG